MILFYTSRTKDTRDADSNTGVILVQRRRRWPKITPVLVQQVVFPEPARAKKSPAPPVE